MCRINENKVVLFFFFEKYLTFNQLSLLISEQEYFKKKNRANSHVTHSILFHSLD